MGGRVALQHQERWRCDVAKLPFPREIAQDQSPRAHEHVSAFAAKASTEAQRPLLRIDPKEPLLGQTSTHFSQEDSTSRKCLVPESGIGKGHDMNAAGAEHNANRYSEQGTSLVRC